MGTTFTGTTPALTRADILHTLGETRATGAAVAWGDGVESALVLWEYGVGVTSSGGFVSRINSAATVARTMTVPDASGTIVLGDGSGVTNAVSMRTAQGFLSDKLTSDFANATVTPATVTDFNIAGLAASSSYHFKALLRIRSAAAATGIKMKITGPTETESFVYHVRTAKDLLFDLTAFGQDIILPDLVGTDTDELLIIEGLLITTSGTPSAPLAIQTWSETDTVAVTLKSGSLMTLTKY